MEISPKILSQLIVQAIILGCALGFLYSVFRLIRVLFGEMGQHSVLHRWMEYEFPLIGKLLKKSAKKHRNRIFVFLLTFITDILFWVFSVIGIILLAHFGNYGRIRWFFPVGAILGFVIFEMTAGRLILCFSEWLALAVRVLVRYIVYVLLFPLKLFYRGISAFFGMVYGKIRMRMQWRRDKIFHAKEIQRLSEAAAAGFGCMNVYTTSEHFINGALESKKK